MRSVWSLPLLAVWACSGASAPPEAPDPALDAAGAPAAAPSAPSEVAPEPPPVAEAVALPPGAPTPGYPTVALVGYGVRLELHPPFQAARMAGMFGSDSADVLVVSWWDVGHEDAGRHGRVGLYNIGIAPAPLPEGSPEVRRVMETDEGEVSYLLQVGETGTKVHLPAGIHALGGMGTLTVGPADPTWGVQVGDAPPVPIPEQELLHSWDPATGSAIEFDRMPKQPYGPWPVRTPSPAAPPAP